MLSIILTVKSLLVDLYTYAVNLKSPEREIKAYDENNEIPKHPAKHHVGQGINKIYHIALTLGMI